MSKSMHSKAARAVACVLVLQAMVGCSKSLDSLDGPLSGAVTGLVCQDVGMLSAVAEVPAVEGTLVQEGKCLRLATPVRVEFLRTVMMPGDGKYSQFEYDWKGKQLRLWISTAKVRT